MLKNELVNRYNTSFTCHICQFSYQSGILVLFPKEAKEQFCEDLAIPLYSQHDLKQSTNPRTRFTQNNPPSALEKENPYDLLLNADIDVGNAL